MRGLKRLSAVLLVLAMLTAFIPMAWGDGSFYRVDNHVYKVKNSYEIANKGSNTAFDIKVSVLIGTNSTSNYQKTLSYVVTPTPKAIRTDSYGNIFGDIVIAQLKAGEKKVITIESTVENSGIDYSDSINKLNPPYTEFKKVKTNLQYLQPGQKVESDEEEIIQKARSFNSNKTIVERAKDIYDFVNLYIEYDTDPIYANQGALSGFRTGRGVCDEYASLFTALCRAAGIPARVVNGYWVTEAMSSGKWMDITDKRHAWAEFYLPTIGWVPVEPTFSYTVNGVKTPNRDYFANIKKGDRHIIGGYQQNNITSNISMYYSYYKKTNLEMKLLGEWLMYTTTAPSAGKKLADIDQSWAKTYIQKLYDMGIVFAREGDFYKPDEKITRAEFAAFLVKALEVNTEGMEAVSYRDVTPGDHLAPYIQAASTLGLIKGDSSGYFHPGDNITRQDAAVIVDRALELLDKEYYINDISSFYDAKDISAYAGGAVKVICNMGIMTGKPNNRFAPRDFTTRAEAAKILDNFMKATVNI